MQKTGTERFTFGPVEGSFRRGPDDYVKVTGSVEVVLDWDRITQMAKKALRNDGGKSRLLGGAIKCRAINRRPIELAQAVVKTQ